MIKRPGKIIPASTIDLFNLQPTTREIILSHLKMEKRSTIPIIMKKFTITESSTRRVLRSLEIEGLVKNLGVYQIGKHLQSVYEIIK